jgi:ketosteroid isomerase-like protein
MSTEPSRRTLFAAGSGALAAAALVSEAEGAHAAESATSRNEMVLRKWYGLWATTKDDWGPFDAILADDFTFTSPAPDDHISKAAFKKKCWEPNIKLTKGFDLELVMAKGDQVFVQYLGHTTGGNTFPNVELHRLRDGRIVSTRCYFGANMSFPSAVDSKG